MAGKQSQKLCPNFNQKDSIFYLYSVALFGHNIGQNKRMKQKIKFIFFKFSRKMKVELENNVKIYCPADCATAAGRIGRICCLLNCPKNRENC
jgi:hypothetical protein